MNIDKDFLDRCELTIGPAISLAYGELKQRIVRLSPYFVPMEQGLCLVKLPSNQLQLYGVSIPDRTVGITQDVLEYVINRLSQESQKSWVLMGFGLGVDISRLHTGYQASIGPTPIVEFIAPNRRVEVTRMLGPLDSGCLPPPNTTVTSLIERYI